MKKNKEKIAQVAKIIARHFSSELGETSLGPCACNAPHCGELRCSNFWEHILMWPNSLLSAMRLYSEAVEIVDSNRLKLRNELNEICTELDEVTHADGADSKR